MGLLRSSCSSSQAIPVGHSLLFAVGAWPPHDGVRRARCLNLSRDLEADAIRFRTLNEITSPIVPTGTTRLRPVRRELELLSSSDRGRCGDELARTALYKAAHSLLIRSTKWSALRAWGMNIAKRRGMARARVTVARKLAVILHRMWVDGSEFRWGKQAATATVVA